jgi:hypothetical protein
MAINQPTLFLSPTLFRTLSCSLLLSVHHHVPLRVRLTYKSVVFALETFVAQRKSLKFLFNLSALALFSVQPVGSISRCTLCQPDRFDVS